MRQIRKARTGGFDRVARRSMRAPPTHGARVGPVATDTVLLYSFRSRATNQGMSMPPDAAQPPSPARGRPAAPAAQPITRASTQAATRPSAPRTSVAISFGSPAAESGIGRLDLNELLVPHPQASFLMRITGDSMQGAGVLDGDLALVDRALDASHGQVVIAVLGDEFVCRRLHRRGADVRLQAAHPAVADWVPGDGEELQVWGVVTHVIRPVSG